MATDCRPVLCAALAQLDLRTHRGEQLALRLNVLHLGDIFEGDFFFGEDGGGSYIYGTGL